MYAAARLQRRCVAAEPAEDREQCGQERAPVVVATALPLRKSRYPTTPRLSVDASQRSPTVVWVMTVHAIPCGTDGGCVSGLEVGVGVGVGVGQAEVVSETDVRPDVLPAASNASTPSVYATPQDNPVNV